MFKICKMISSRSHLLVTVNFYLLIQMRLLFFMIEVVVELNGLALIRMSFIAVEHSRFELSSLRRLDRAAEHQPKPLSW